MAQQQMPMQNIVDWYSANFTPWMQLVAPVNQPQYAPVEIPEYTDMQIDVEPWVVPPTDFSNVMAFHPFQNIVNWYNTALTPWAQLLNNADQNIQYSRNRADAMKEARRARQDAYWAPVEEYGYYGPMDE